MNFYSIFYATLVSIATADYTIKPGYNTNSPIQIPENGCSSYNNGACCESSKWWDNQCHDCEKNYHWNGKCNDQNQPNYPSHPQNPDYSYCKSRGLLEANVNLRVLNLIGVNVDLEILSRCRLLYLNVNANVGRRSF